MPVFLVGAGLFIIAFVIHVVVWKVRRPHHQAASLVLLFLFVGLAGFGGIWLLKASGGSALSILRAALAILLYLSCCMFYFLLFSAVDSDSPTLTLIGIIRKRGLLGISREQLSQEMAKYSFVRPRLTQMINDGFLVQVGDRLHAGRRGRILATLVLSYRRLLGDREAGG